MQKMLALALVLTTMGMLAGCGDTANPDGEDESQTMPMDTQPSREEIQQTLPGKEGSGFTEKELEERKPGGSHTPGEGAHQQ